MRRALLALVLLAGCLRSTGGNAGATFAGIGAASGLVYGIACGDYGASDHHCESTDARVLGAAILITIIGGTALAIISEVTYHPSATATDETPPPPAPEAAPTGAALYEPIDPRVPLAHQLAVQAHNAAQRGQCAGIPALAKRVRALDAEYYARVFAPDPPIARCGI